MRLLGGGTVLLVLLPTGVAGAQLCVGNTGFSLTHVQPSANADFDHLAQRYTIEARFHFHHAFGAVEYGLKTWEVTSLDGTSHAESVTLGFDAGPEKERMSICPMVRLGWLSGPHEIEGSLWSFSEHSFAAGVSVGFLTVRDKLWDFMPTMSLMFGSANPKLTTAYGGNLDQYQDFCCGSQSFGTFKLGFGIGYSDDVTLIPSVTWPLGDGAQTTYGIRAVFRLGGL